MIFKNKTFWMRFGISVGVSVIVFAGVVLGLVWVSPTAEPHASHQNLQFNELVIDNDTLPSLQTYHARDGQELDYRYYDGGNADKTLILLHGSAYHSQYLAPLAQYLAEQNVAHVYTPDMRGHGTHPADRGDIAYIGQLENDITDFIEVVQQENDTQVYLGGHSSGGGTAIRYAGGDAQADIAGYVLLAPYIHYSAPTFPENESGWTNVNTPRMIGLSILNALGIMALNDTDVISFNMPEKYRDGTETLYYSYDLQTSMHPRDDYEAAIQSLPEDTLVLIGSDDETFIADAYAPLFHDYAPESEVMIVAETSHFGVVLEQTAQQRVDEWLESRSE